MSLRWPAWAVIVVCVIVGARSWAEDTVTVTNDSGDENGVMVWGSREDTIVFSGHSSAIHDVDRGEWNQIVAFTKGRPPALDGHVNWTQKVDAISVRYPDAFEVPVKVWVLCANQSCQGITPAKKTKLAAFLVWANERLEAERAGFKLVPSGNPWIEDVTTLTGSPHDVLMNFDKTKCGKFDGAIQTIKASGSINLYMVDMVDGDERRGRQCRQNHDSAVIGRLAIKGTILHEIGHILSLNHTDAETWFDDVGGDKNIMCSQSSQRRSLTEGQVFRIHFSIDSGFNDSQSSIYRSPQTPGRDCTSTTELPCPAVETMLWSDP